MIANKMLKIGIFQKNFVNLNTIYHFIINYKTIYNYYNNYLKYQIRLEKVLLLQYYNRIKVKFKNKQMKK